MFIKNTFHSTDDAKRGTHLAPLPYAIKKEAY